MQIAVKKEGFAHSTGIRLNGEWLLKKGASIKWSESFSGLISTKAKAKGCVSQLAINYLDCSRPVFSELWSATGVQGTGLKDLELMGLPASLGVHALTLLQQNAIHSLTYLEFGYNPTWWTQGEAFSLLTAIIQS